MNKSVVLFLFMLFLVGLTLAQRLPDQVYLSNIKTVKLNRFGDPLTYPVLALNSSDLLELNYDDLDGGVKNYYYTLTLCNADWTPAQLSYFDYVKGYSQVRINTYRNSSISLTRYTHYQATLPDRNCQPIKSGNYLLKVFLNGDTSQLAFTKRFLVVDNKLSVAIQVTQPFNQEYFQTHHRFQVQVDTRNFDVRYPQQQIRIEILQNYRWDNKLTLTMPTFTRQELLQYSNENEMLMPAGKEYRWLNLRSFRLLGDRISKQQNTDSSFSLFVKEDQSRLPKQYFFYKDNNGLFINETIETINPFWNADYAKVHFSYRPTNSLPREAGDLVVFGELTNYGKDPEATLIYNPQKGVYETDLFLKQGYYDYQYALKEIKSGSIRFNSS
jgi:hypothetical protein